MNQIIQCVPNFSEGKEIEIIKKIIQPFEQTEGVILLDYSMDPDHNRAVVSVVGEREPLKKAVVEAIGIAGSLIDLRAHKGQHPRMGATDVVPFIPIKNATMEDCVSLSREVAEAVYQTHHIPSFLYEKSARTAARQNLAALRKGEFEGMPEKIKDPDWSLDYGIAVHERAGVVAIGARMPLVAFNVNLGTDQLEWAKQIGKNVRHTSGGLRYCKALGMMLEDRGITQVSMNMTDFSKTPLYRSLELIKVEARRYGVDVIGTEIIGLVSAEALCGSLDYYLKDELYDREDYEWIANKVIEVMQLENFSVHQILEKKIADKV